MYSEWHRNKSINKDNIINPTPKQVPMLSIPNLRFFTQCKYFSTIRALKH